MFHSKTKIVKWLYEMGRTWELVDDSAKRWWNYKIQNHILSGRQSSWGTYKWIWERLYLQTFEETEKIFGLEKRNLFFPTNWFESCWRSFRPGLIDGGFVLKIGVFKPWKSNVSPRLSISWSNTNRNIWNWSMSFLSMKLSYFCNTGAITQIGKSLKQNPE